MADTLRRAILDHHQEHPDRLIFRCLLPGGEIEEVTYARLVRRGTDFADAATALGGTAGEVVVIVLPHSADLLCAFFGCVLGGQIPTVLAVPSFKLNPEHYREELEALLQRINAQVLVTDTETASRLGIRDQVGRSGVLLADRLPAGSRPVPEADPRPEDIVLLQHSSGSTGLKKGVALSNRAVLRQARDYAPTIAMGPGDHIASWLPLYHDMGLIACTVIPAALGIPVTVLSPLHWVTRPVTLLEAISRHKCTLTWQPNFAYEFLAARVRKSQLDGIRLDSMRGWINCAEPTVASSHRHFLERFENLGVRAETLWTCYAMAETVFAVSQSSPQALPLVEHIDREAFQTEGVAIAPRAAESGSVEVMSGGVPIPGVEVRVVGDDRSPLPPRRVGEIAVRCDFLFQGYFRDPEATRQVLTDGWYRTGDLGYLADGHLFITGRKKDLIIVAGKNYYPQDIERVVSAVPGIYPGRVVALGLDDPDIGTQRLIVLAELERPAQSDELEVSGRVRSELANELDCVIDDLRLLPHMWLLKTSSGKIARAPNLRRYLDLLRPPAKAREE